MFQVSWSTNGIRIAWAVPRESNEYPYIDSLQKNISDS